MAKGKMLTDAALKKMKPGDNATDSLPGRGSGSIYFECRESGSVTAYYRYRHEGRTKKSRIGFYTNKAHSAGYSLTEIREQARQLARIAAEHGDVGCYLEEQAAAAEAERARRQRQAEIEASRGSFGELLDSYADSLEQSGKVSAGEVRQLFKTHVKDHYPKLTARIAAEIEPEDIQLILAGLLQRKPKGRGIANRAAGSAANGMRTTTDKLRRYLRAAFSYAAKAHLAPERLAHDGKVFSIRSNPVRDIPVIQGSRRADTESLTPAELGELMRYLDTLPERRAAIAQALIYFGGQRLRQLCAVTWEGVTDETITLFDSKGRKSEAWEHLLPITPRIAEVIAPLLADRAGPGPICFTPGQAASPDTLSKIFTDAGRALSAAGKTRCFTWKTIRVTCESLMAAQGVTPSVRAWLLSHGRSDVQSRHYDRYSYLPEKIAALEQWGRYLDRLKACEEGESGNVVLLTRRKG